MMVGVFFASVGVLCAQLMSDRRTATGLAAGLLIAGLLARMVADGVEQLAWLAWLTPFGLMAEVEPYGAGRVAPLMVLAGYAMLAGALAVVSARHRDVGTGVFDRAGTRPSRMALLGSIGGFAVRRTVAAFAGWAGGLCAYFFLIGLLARSLTAFLTANPRFAEMAAQAGFAGLTTPQGYLASLFALLAIPLGLFATTRLAVEAADEVEGRLSLVFSRPVTRRRWAAVQLAVLAGACIGLALLAGTAAWSGATIVGARLSPWEALAGTVNVTPIALLSLAAAMLALGWAPRAVVPVGAIPAVGGFLLTVLGELFNWPRWVGSLSPFAHLAPVPSTHPDWTGAAGLLAVSLVLATAGLFAYTRRDLRS
jgi:ABC-2 type transport system permease protein